MSALPDTPTDEAAQVLDGPRLARWLHSAAAALRAAREEIDALNVFPVPDRDTGTNLALTVTAAADAVAAGPDDAHGPDGAHGPHSAHGAAGAGAGVLAAAAADAALTGARGNSGNILAAWLAGFADAAGPGRALSGRAVAGALRAAASSAARAVAAPVEGTILSVARTAAEAAARVPESAPVSAVTAAAAAAARAALRRTPAQLPALRAAGVVDAGGRGLVLLLEALAGNAAGAGPPRRESGPDRPAGPALDPSPAPPAGPGSALEVQYLLTADPAAAPVLRALRQALSGIGDSVVVSGRTGRLRVHVHVADRFAADAALAAGRQAGRLVGVSLSPLAASRDSSRHVLAVTPDTDGVGLLAEAGANVAAGPPAPAGFADWLAMAVPAATSGREVVILPVGTDASGAGGTGADAGTAVTGAGAGDTGAAGAGAGGSRAAAPAAAGAAPDRRSGTAAALARAVADAAERAGATLVVLPACALPQALAALAVSDPGAPLPADAARMADAAQAVRWAALPAPSGDLSADGCELVHEMLDSGGERLTLLLGAGATDDLAGRLRAEVQAGSPAVEVEVLRAGDLGAALVVGVE